MDQIIESAGSATRNRLIDLHLEDEVGEKHTMAPRRGERESEIQPEDFAPVEFSATAFQPYELEMWWIGLPWWLKPFHWFWYIETREMELQIGPMAGWGRERNDEKLRPLVDPLIYIVVFFVVLSVAIGLALWARHFIGY